MDLRSILGSDLYQHVCISLRIGGDCMSKTLQERGKPRGFLRLLLRLPIWLYRVRAGWLLGSRFLMLEHCGRRSGLRHRTVLEVVDHDLKSGSYIVASGWGPASDWFRNVKQTPDVTVWVGRRRFPAAASQMGMDAAVTALRSYSTRNPGAFRQLARMMVDGHLGDPDEACHKVAQRVPLVRLVPLPSNGA